MNIRPINFLNKVIYVFEVTHKSASAINKFVCISLYPTFAGESNITRPFYGDNSISDNEKSLSLMTTENNFDVMDGALGCFDENIDSIIVMPNDASKKAIENTSGISYASSSTDTSAKDSETEGKLPRKTSQYFHLFVDFVFR